MFVPALYQVLLQLNWCVLLSPDPFPDALEPIWAALRRLGRVLEALCLDGFWRSGTGFGTKSAIWCKSILQPPCLTQTPQTHWKCTKVIEETEKKARRPHWFQLSILNMLKITMKRISTFSRVWSGLKVWSRQKWSKEQGQRDWKVCKLEKPGKFNIYLVSHSIT